MDVPFICDFGEQFLTNVGSCVETMERQHRLLVIIEIRGIKHSNYKLRCVSKI